MFNYYKAITYMCSYLSKEEDEFSQAMKQAFKETLESGASYYEQMKSVAHAYSSKRECTLQEAVYHIMSELWLRKVFPTVVNINSNLPEKRVKMILNKNELRLLPEDSTDIYKRNMVSRYIIRPQDTVLNQLCYASFVKNYQLLPKQMENDSQPNELSDEVIEENHSLTDSNSYPKNITLSTGEKLRCRKVEFVLRYHVPNRHKDPEAYAHHLLFMFYPFRNEEELKVGESNSYCAKLQQAGVTDVINQNKSRVEPFGELVDEAFLNFRSDLPSWDPFMQQENDGVNSDLYQGEDNEAEQSDINQNSATSHSFSGNATLSAQIHTVLTDNELSEKVRSLNVKQRQVFHFIYNWAKSCISKCANGKQVPVPFHIFLSVGGGCGKSHLIKIIYHSVNKVFLHQSENPEKPRVLVLAPTGVAAININGTTIHSGLMVSGKLLYQVHRRLNEIFHPLQNIPFGGTAVLVCVETSLNYLQYKENQCSCSMKQIHLTDF